LLKLTTDQVLLFHSVAASSQVIALGKEGLSAKAKILCKLTPWCVVEFSSFRLGLIYILVIDLQ